MKVKDLIKKLEKFEDREIVFIDSYITEKGVQEFFRTISHFQHILYGDDIVGVELRAYDQYEKTPFDTDIQGEIKNLTKEMDKAQDDADFYKKMIADIKDKGKDSIYSKYSRKGIIE